MTPTLDLATVQRRPARLEPDADRLPDAEGFSAALEMPVREKEDPAIGVEAEAAPAPLTLTLARRATLAEAALRGATPANADAIGEDDLPAVDEAAGPDDPPAPQAEGAPDSPPVILETADPAPPAVAIVPGKPAPVMSPGPAVATPAPPAQPSPAGPVAAATEETPAGTTAPPPAPVKPASASPAPETRPAAPPAPVQPLVRPAEARPAPSPPQPASVLAGLFGGSTASIVQDTDLGGGDDRQPRERFSRNDGSGRPPRPAPVAERVLPDARPAIQTPAGMAATVAVTTQPASAALATAPALGAAIAADPAWQAYFRELPGQQPAQPLKSLSIRLNPAELGMVTASLVLDGDAARVEIRTETAAAQRRLAADSDAIVRALRSAGIEVASVTIQHQPAAEARQGVAADASGGGFQAAQHEEGGETRRGRTSSGDAAFTSDGEHAFAGTGDGDRGDAGGDRYI